MNVFDSFPYLNNLITPEELECLKVKSLQETNIYSVSQYDDLIRRIKKQIRKEQQKEQPGEILIYFDLSIALLEYKKCVFDSLPGIFESDVTDMFKIITQLEKVR